MQKRELLKHFKKAKKILVMAAVLIVLVVELIIQIKFFLAILLI